MKDTGGGAAGNSMEAAGGEPGGGTAGDGLEAADGGAGGGWKGSLGPPADVA